MASSEREKASWRRLRQSYVQFREGEVRAANATEEVLLELDAIGVAAVSGGKGHVDLRGKNQAMHRPGGAGRPTRRES